MLFCNLGQQMIMNNIIIKQGNGSTACLKSVDGPYRPNKVLTNDLVKTLLV